MPTSKTIYESFDGKEFPDEEDAQTYEEWVRGCGVELREQFFDKRMIGNHLDLIEPKLLDLIKSYSDDDAWKIMKSLNCAGLQLSDRRTATDNTDWLDPY
tara:strand:- start:293 stop:592 length:300 start_codon:yes stop_codon:yes gene_type:complete